MSISYFRGWRGKKHCLCISKSIGHFGIYHSNGKKTKEWNVFRWFRTGKKSLVMMMHFRGDITEICSKPPTKKNIHWSSSCNRTPESRVLEGLKIVLFFHSSKDRMSVILILVSSSRGMRNVLFFFFYCCLRIYCSRKRCDEKFYWDRYKARRFSKNNRFDCFFLRLQWFGSGVLFIIWNRNTSVFIVFILRKFFFSFSLQDIQDLNVLCLKFKSGTSLEALR